MLAERLHHDFPGLSAVLLDAFGLLPSDAEACGLGGALYRMAVVSKVDDPRAHERLGEVFHLRKHLAEAGDCYRRALEIEPPRELSGRERDRVFRHAPILKTHTAEFFPLRDVAAIHHRNEPLIAYHLFWEDDYNFPDDYEPCDHEQIWVRYDPSSDRVEAVHAFFHSRILSSAEAAEEANGNEGRPVVSVEWGLHGSLPAAWARLRCPLTGKPIEGILEDNHRGVAVGGRASDHPLKRRWPGRFEGSFDDYRRFEGNAEPRDLLEKNGMILGSRLSNAVIQQYFLRYNFAPKYDWPFPQVPLPVRTLRQMNGV